MVEQVEPSMQIVSEEPEVGEPVDIAVTEVTVEPIILPALQEMVEVVAEEVAVRLSQ